MVKYTLSPDSIEKLISDLRVYMTENRVAKRDVVRTCLLTEEMLLKYKDAFGEDVIVEMDTVSRIWKAGVQFSIYSDKYDPFDENEGDLLRSLTATTVQSNPVWKYVKPSSAWAFNRKGCNEITLTVPKMARVSNPVRLVITILFCIMFSLATKAFLSPENCEILAEQFVLPVANAYANLLSVMAILMIFFALPLCIVQYGSIASFQRSTKKAITTFAMIPLVAIILLFLISLRFISAGSAIGDGVGITKSILDVFLNFVPGNILAPFLNFNCIQVMFIGLIFGLCFLVMGNESKPLVNTFDRVNFVAVLTNGYLNRFVFLYVGVMAYYLVLTDYSVLFTELLPVILILAGMCLLAMVGFALTACLRLKLKASVLLKKFMPTFLVGLSSASVGASFVNLFDSLTKDCGVDLSYANMSINLATVLFKPLYTVFLAVCGTVAAYYTDCLSFPILVQIMLMAYILPVSIPNIQGGATSVILLMFSQIGIGNGMAELIVTINTLLQFLIVPTNLFCTQCVILLLANKEKKLNAETLKKSVA